MREQLNRLVDEMLTKGILYDDARREIEKRFITSALARSNGNLGRAAKEPIDVIFNKDEFPLIESE